MIYETVQSGEPIRQGDIFLDLPRVDLSLQQIIRVKEDESIEETSWNLVKHTPDGVEAVVSLRSVHAIVISQDCDSIRAPDLSLCVIQPFSNVERQAQSVSAPKTWVKMIVQQARKNQKWFYLPPGDNVPFGEKMAVDFLQTIRLSRADLEQSRSQRVARLNGVAAEHFRERISEFFRRYPYDEWYPLNKEELKSYSGDAPEAIKPFPWQNGFLD